MLNKSDLLRLINISILLSFFMYSILVLSITKINISLDSYMKMNNNTLYTVTLKIL